MGLWNRIFNRDNAEIEVCLHTCGRYSDAHKSADHYTHFDEANRLFEKNHYRDAVIHFLAYLKNDEGDNVTVQENQKNLEFQLLQGSKVISGSLEDGRILMRSPLVSGSEYSVNLLRRLLEKNYDLNYCRFALDEQNQLHTIFESYVKDANPYKLYYGLKEMSLQADKMDDLILSEFDSFKARNIEHTRDESIEIVELKTNLFYRKLQVLQDNLDSGYLSRTHDRNIVVYAILSTFYKIDFLLVPQGQTGNIIERAHHAFYADSTESIEIKISKLKEAITKLQALDTGMIKREWYKVIYTFGINPPVDLQQVQQYIQPEINKVQWYIRQNKFDEAATTVDFIVGYILFNYAVDPLLKSLLLFHYRITHHTFFKEMKFEGDFIKSNGELKKNKLISELKQTIDFFEDDYHAVKIPIDLLQFDNEYHFGYSLLNMIASSYFIEMQARN